MLKLEYSPHYPPPMQAQASATYKRGLEGLSSLQQRFGLTKADVDFLAVIEMAAWLAEAEVPDRLFPFVGRLDDVRDRQVVEAYKSAFQSFITGEDEYDD